MSEDSQQNKGHQGDHHGDPDGGQANGQFDGQIDGEPPRPLHVPNQGLRKRTSVLVGLGLMLIGLLMLFIAGGSAASVAPTQRAIQSFTPTYLCNDTGEFH